MACRRSSLGRRIRSPYSADLALFANHGCHTDLTNKPVIGVLATVLGARRSLLVGNDLTLTLAIVCAPLLRLHPRGVVSAQTCSSGRDSFRMCFSGGYPRSLCLAGIIGQPRTIVSTMQKWAMTASRLLGFSLASVAVFILSEPICAADNPKPCPVPSSSVAAKDVEIWPARANSSGCYPCRNRHDHLLGGCRQIPSRISRLGLS